MPDHDDHEPSGDQRRWEVIALKLREQLAARIADVPAMTPEECSSLVTALYNARLIGEQAALHDKQIAVALAKLYCDQ